MTDETKGFSLPDFRMPQSIDPGGVVMDGIYRAGQLARQQQKAVADAASHSLEAASRTVAAITARIEHFEKGLGDREELALFIVGGPAGMTFFPTAIASINPDKVVFEGRDAEGQAFEVIQHISQLNFAMKVVTVEPADQPRRIGFHSPGE